MTRRGARTIAIVGVGPRGLYCCERIAAEAAAGRLAATDLHLFEPHPFPGAGAVYDPRQPSYLRMNFANRHVDLWSHPVDGPAFPGGRPTLVDWLAQRRPAAADADGYAPRGAVGEYLHDGFRQVAEVLRRYLEVSLHAAAVERVERHGDGWRVATADGPPLVADEVVVATGHGSRRRRRDAPPPHPRWVPAVYPVDRHLDVDRVPPGSRVAVRGLGLTALDAVLALTEGRGGRFVATDRPGRCSYRPSYEEPAAIFPFSRSGLAMRPKPDGAAAGAPAATDDDPAARHRRLLAAAETHGVREALFSALTLAAQRALAAAGVGGGLSALLHALERMAGGGAPPAAGGGLYRELEAGVEIAYGARPPDAAWALGEAWRNLYPALVELVARRAVGAAEWPWFSQLAAGMEKLAFGPPADNAARFLALVDAGVVDLAAVAGPAVSVGDRGVELTTARTVRRAELAVDAVLPPPGTGFGTGEPLAGLLAAGEARTLPWNGGVEVGRDGRCIAAGGEVNPTLAVLGRATEGCVLGNDTLNRSLHRTAERWAAGLVAARPATSAVAVRRAVGA